MTRIKCLVAKQDGEHSLFAPGSITPTKNVPVTRGFNQQLLPVSTADVTVDGVDVYAEFEVEDWRLVIGLFPALGVVAEKPRLVEGRTVEPLTECRVLEVGLCASPNVDPRIPALFVRGMPNPNEPAAPEE